MQHHAADQLDVEMALAERALAGFADGGEGRRQDIVEGCPFGELLLEFAGARAQRFVGERFQLLFQGIDRFHARAIRADATVVGGTEQLTGDSADHRIILLDFGLARRSA